MGCWGRVRAKEQKPRYSLGQTFWFEGFAWGCVGSGVSVLWPGNSRSCFFRGFAHLRPLSGHLFSLLSHCGLGCFEIQWLTYNHWLCPYVDSEQFLWKDELSNLVFEGCGWECG